MVPWWYMVAILPYKGLFSPKYDIFTHFENESSSDSANNQVSALETILAPGLPLTIFLFLRYWIFYWIDFYFIELIFIFFNWIDFLMNRFLHEIDTNGIAYRSTVEGYPMRAALLCPALYLSSVLSSIMCLENCSFSNRYKVLDSYAGHHDLPLSPLAP